MQDYTIKTLTPDEIQSLQVDAALRLIGENTGIMLQINSEMQEALQEQLRVQLKINRLKEDKQTVIQLNKSLAMIAKHSY